MSNKKKNIKIIGERDFNLHLSNPDHHDSIATIGKALSSKIRIRILDLLKNNVMSLQEISDILDIPYSSTALHIKTLEDAKLIVSESQPGIHGLMRVCTCSMQSLSIQTFDPGLDTIDNTVSMDMPIGNYYQCEVQPTCGLADEDGIIDAYDNVKSFYSPFRSKAQLIWFDSGYIEYRFPNISNPLLTLSEISFSMEICSEAPGYHENWPSDITVSINGVELSTYLSPGDYGARRGKLTPKSWPNGRSQYGMLKIFSVRDTGSYIDGHLVNRSISLEQLKIDDKPYFSLKIEIKEDAQHRGGINLFGEKYGDYPQGIVMNLIY